MNLWQNPTLQYQKNAEWGSVCDPGELDTLSNSPPPAIRQQKLPRGSSYTENGINLSKLNKSNFHTPRNKTVISFLMYNCPGVTPLGSGDIVREYVEWYTAFWGNNLMFRSTLGIYIVHYTIYHPLLFLFSLSDLSNNLNIYFQNILSP